MGNCWCFAASPWCGLSWYLCFVAWTGLRILCFEKMLRHFWLPLHIVADLYRGCLDHRRRSEPSFFQATQQGLSELDVKGRTGTLSEHDTQSRFWWEGGHQQVLCRTGRPTGYLGCRSWLFGHRIAGDDHIATEVKQCFDPLLLSHFDRGTLRCRDPYSHDTRSGLVRVALLVQDHYVPFVWKTGLVSEVCSR